MCCSIVSKWGPAVTDESFSLSLVELAVSSTSCSSSATRTHEEVYCAIVGLAQAIVEDVGLTGWQRLL